MTTPISNNGAARTQTINMDAVTVPPPRTPAAGGAAPPRGTAPVRDEFSPRASTTNSAQGTSGTSRALTPQLRAELEGMRRQAESIRMPDPATPSVPRPMRNLEQTTRRQHDAMGHHAWREARLAVVGVLAHGTPLAAVATVLSAGARTIDHMAEGESVPRALGHAARDVVVEHVEHMLEGHSPLANDPGLRLGGTGLVQGGVATFEAAAHIRQDMNERVRVAQEESAYRAAVDALAQRESESRSYGRIAANAIGTPGAPLGVDMARLATDHAYAVAFRQRIDERLQGQ